MTSTTKRGRGLSASWSIRGDGLRSARVGSASHGAGLMIVAVPNRGYEPARFAVVDDVRGTLVVEKVFPKVDDRYVAPVREAMYRAELAAEAELAYRDGAGREAYLSIADELDSFGVEKPTTLDELDPGAIALAKRYAEDEGLVFPPLDGVDLALERVARNSSLDVTYARG